MKRTEGRGGHSRELQGKRREPKWQHHDVAMMSQGPGGEDLKIESGKGLNTPGPQNRLRQTYGDFGPAVQAANDSLRMDGSIQKPIMRKHILADRLMHVNICVLFYGTSACPSYD